MAQNKTTRGAMPRKQSHLVLFLAPTELFLRMEGSNEEWGNNRNKNVKRGGRGRNPVKFLKFLLGMRNALKKTLVLLHF